MRWKMAASYKKLFKMLIDREMKSKDLAAKAGISPATLAKMKKDGATVSSDVLVKICTALECKLDDMLRHSSAVKKLMAKQFLSIPLFHLAIMRYYFNNMCIGKNPI